MLAKRSEGQDVFKREAIQRNNLVDGRRLKKGKMPSPKELPQNITQNPSMLIFLFLC